MLDDKLNLAETREEFSKRMQEFEARLRSASQSNPDVASIAADFASFKDFTLKSLGSLQHQLDLLAREVDNQEMRSRRKIILIHGVPEGKQEDTASVVKTTVNSQLKLAEFSLNDIDRCHRMGRATSLDKPRPLLVKVRDIATRDRIWFAKANFKGTNMTLSEFLTKSRHEAFMAARQRFGIKQCWSRDGFVHVLGPDGSRHRISSLAELQKIPAPTELQKAVQPPVYQVTGATGPQTRRVTAAAGAAKKK